MHQSDEKIYLVWLHIDIQSEEANILARMNEWMTSRPGVDDTSASLLLAVRIVDGGKYNYI